MKLLVNLIRLLTAFTFIFSGFVKMIDPAGTQIKMLEYFGEDVLNLTFLSPYALEISIFMILVEFVLGMWLLMGYKAKFTLYSLFALILFFLFLTGYSAFFNKVTDCGCFGDAVKLTPWETFYKNVILLIFILFLIWKKEYIRPLFSQKIAISAYLPVLGGMILMIYTVRHLPLIDFRPYAIGKNIREGMQIPEGAPQAQFKDIWYYKVNGEIKEFSNEDEPWNIPGAEFVDRKTITLSEGYTPPIHDFSIENDTEGDITEEVLNEPEIYLLISAKPYEISSDAQSVINKYAQELQKQNKKIIGLFSVVDEELEEQFAFPLYMTDETTLKTMIRSNPGMIKLESGTVTDKKAWRDLD